MASSSGLDADYVERKLANHGWQASPLTFRGTLRFGGTLQSNDMSLLVKQKKVIEEIAALGKDCVIIGRNADVILRSYKPFNIFVCAEASAKIKRCMERSAEDERLTERELSRKMRQVDKTRAQTRAILSGLEWGQRDTYHLTVNTTDWIIEELAPAAAEFANRWFRRA